MATIISTSQLKIGMYVNLSSAWHAHPFLTNSFTITSPQQIKKIANFGIKTVSIDENKGIPVEEALQQDMEQPDKNFAQGLTAASEKLQETLDNHNLPLPERAGLVHSHSVDMIKNLWGTPIGEKIAEFKRGIFGIVEMLLAHNDAVSYLLRLTSYDYNEYIHSANVGLLGTALAISVLQKKDRHDLHALAAGFFLHDIGKIKIDEAILNKKGELTREEMDVMRKHPGMGFRILNEARQMGDESRIIVLQHHERNNGSGYPRRLRGNEIHLYGKICSVADVFDALASKRNYRTQLTAFEALKTMKEEMLDHFQRDIFEKFVLLFK
ncbi:MAG TPA: DUF3391 domain-containing protein [Smithellaceae bacterium]|nr:DUF3391 domain-containing protein [Smithellaceae bacterium]HQM46013.1 DUF3391 domain-containing protein [Smithellaceae bacterium]